jgi:cell division protein YceG involved in septum cleavage
MINLINIYIKQILFFIIFLLIGFVCYLIYNNKSLKKENDLYKEEQKKVELLNVNNNQNINEIKKKLPSAYNIDARRKLLEQIY